MAEKLGSAVLELSTDNRSLTAGLSRAKKSVQRLNASLKRMGRQASTYITAPITALGTATALLADKQLRAEQTLETVLALSGKNAKTRLAGMKEFAAALQAATIIGDEATLQNIQVAKSMGLSDDQAKNAARNAIALSAAFGINAQSAIRYTAALEEGDTEMLNRYIPTLRNIEDQSERVAAAQQILADSFSIATTQAKTGLGPFRQMLNDLSDLGEEFGTVIIPSITTFAEKIRDVIAIIRELTPVQKEWITRLAAGLAVGGPVLLGLALLTTALSALLSPIALVVLAVGGLTTAWVVWGDDIKTAVGGAIDWAVTKITDFITWMTEIPNRLFEIGSDMITSLLAGFTGEDIETKMRRIGMETTAGLVSGLLIGRDDVGDAGADIAAYLAQTTEDTLEIKSPSRVFQRIGRDVAAGLALGINDGQAVVAESINQLSSNMGGGALQQYADSAAKVGKSIGDSLAGAFGRAENAISKFVETGKFDFKDFARSIIADLASIAIRSTILGPIAKALGGALGGGGGIFAGLFHSGGLVGAGGMGRIVPPAMFAQAPRMHDGGIAGLAPNEVPAILEKGERVIPKDGGGALQVSLGPGLEATWLKKSAAQTVQIVGASMSIQDRKTGPNLQNFSARQG